MAVAGATGSKLFQKQVFFYHKLVCHVALPSPLDFMLPLQPVLYSVVGQHSTDWPLLTAALTMSVLPIIAVYIRMQRRFVILLLILVPIHGIVWSGLLSASGAFAIRHVTPRMAAGHWNGIGSPTIRDRFR